MYKTKRPLCYLTVSKQGIQSGYTDIKTHVFFFNALKMDTIKSILLTA